MEVKTGAEFVWLNKHPSGVMLVNVSHIEQINSGVNCVTVTLYSGRTIKAEYTLDTIAQILFTNEKGRKATL